MRLYSSNKIRNSFLLSTVLATLFLVSASTPSNGQVVGGSISGTVKDQSGAALPAVSVTLRNVDTGAERIALTDASGRYLAPSISVGNYRISASKEGFSTQAITGITLVVGQSTTVDVVLPWEPCSRKWK